MLIGGAAHFSSLLQQHQLDNSKTRCQLFWGFSPPPFSHCYRLVGDGHASGRANCYTREQRKQPGKGNFFFSSLLRSVVIHTHTEAEMRLIGPLTKMAGSNQVARPKENVVATTVDGMKLIMSLSQKVMMLGSQRGEIPHGQEKKKKKSRQSGSDRVDDQYLFIYMLHFFFPVIA